MSGHAGLESGFRGANTVCAAVTVLARSCADAVASHPGVVARGSAPLPGALSLSVVEVAHSEVNWLRGVTDVLVGGMRRLATEAPEEIELRIEG